MTLDDQRSRRDGGPEARLLGRLSPPSLLCPSPRGSTRGPPARASSGTSSDGRRAAHGLRGPLGALVGPWDRRCAQLLHYHCDGRYRPDAPDPRSEARDSPSYTGVPRDL